MEISRLATTYRRSISVTLPNGREAWIAHETMIEATYGPGELEGMKIPENFEALRQVAIQETARAIKREKEALEEAGRVASEETEEAFPSQESSLAKLPRL